MLDFNKFLIPMKPKKGNDFSIKWDGKLNKNVAILLFSDPLATIQESIFSENYFKYFYQEIRRKDYFNNIYLREKRVDYPIILKNTHIIKCPIDSGLLNNFNCYFDYSREYESIVTHQRADNYRVKLQFVSKLLCDAIENIGRLGYSDILVYVDSTKLGLDNPNSFMSTVMQALRYGWQFSPPSKVQFRLVIGNRNTLTLKTTPITISTDPIDASLRQLFRSKLAQVVYSANKNNSDITIDDELFKQDTVGLTNTELSTIMDIDSSSASSSMANEKDKYSATEKNFYVCSSNITPDSKIKIVGRVEPVFNSTNAAIGEVFKFNEADLIKKPLKSFDMFITLNKAGFKLARVKELDNVRYGSNSSFLDKDTKVEIISAGKNDDLVSRVSNDFIIASATNDLKELAKTNLFKKLNAFSKDEQEIFDDMIQIFQIKISTFLESNPNVDIETFTKYMKEILNSSDVTVKIAAIMTSRTVLAKKQKSDELSKQMAATANAATISVDGVSKSIAEINKEINDNSPGKKVPIDTPLEFMKHAVADDIDQHYVKNNMIPDIVKIAQSFNNEYSEPAIFVKAVDIKDTSDEFNLKSALSISFNIPEKKPQTIQLDFPTLSADGYLFTGGTKKFINKQIITLPITYIKSLGQNSVQFTTNYNKVFIEKIGQRLNSTLSRFIKASLAYRQKSDKFAKGCRTGNISNYIGSLSNNTTLHIKDLTNHLVGFNFGNTQILFDPREVSPLMFEMGYENLNSYPLFKENYVVIGFNNGADKSIILTDQSGNIYFYKDGKTEYVSSFDDFLISKASSFDSGFIDEFNSTSAGKKYMYSSIKAIGRKIPLVVFIGWRVGLSYILDNYKVDYEWSVSKKPSNPLFSESIQFKDKYLHYKYTIKHGLLLNGLSELNSEEYDVLEFEARGNAYKSWFISTASSNLGKAIDNFYSVFIDPITKEILEDLQIPSDLANACIYCNTMLESCISNRKNDMDYYRLRGFEAIVGMIYKIIGNAVNRYRNSASNMGAQMPLSVKSDTLMKELSSSPILEELKLMNPNKEARNRMKATYKGPAGINFASAKGSEEIREFSKSMVGSLTPTTMDSDLAGITRFLSMNPMIYGKRGIIKASSINLKDLNAGNILNIAELLSPFTADHADSPRFGMQLSQAGHQIPTVKMDPPLIGCHAEKAIKYAIGDDFIFKAKQNGKIIEIDNKHELVMIQYEDGTKAAIDMSIKNGRVADGYYISVHLDLDPRFKVGSSFKKDDILANDRNYFIGSGNDAILASGTLTNVVIGSEDATYEDSSLISDELKENLGAFVTFDKKVSINYTANISNIKGIGQNIRAGEPLLAYEEVFGAEDDSISRLLTKIGDKFQEAIDEYSTSNVPSKYSGEIVDMRIYYNRDIEEFSESIQDLIRKYQKKNSAKAKKLNDTRRDHVVYVPTVEKVNTDRIAGQEFDGILIHYFIKSLNFFIPGNKLAVGVALKSIIGSVWDKGKNPITSLEKADSSLHSSIGLYVSPFSTASRMVPDVYLQGYGNKAQILLKRKIALMMKAYKK